MASSDSVRFPNPGQGVHVILGDGPGVVQYTAVVEGVDPSGALRLRLPATVDPEPLIPEATVTVQYFREGTIFHIHTSIGCVRSTPPESPEEGAVHRLELRPPHSGQSVRRRRFPRLEIALPLRYVRVDMPQPYDRGSWRGRRMLQRWGKQLARAGSEAWTAVVSAGGLRIADEQPLALDDAMYLQIDLAHTSLQVAGRVVWVSDPGQAPGVGIEFVGATDEAQREIARFVRSYEASLQRPSVRPLSG